MQTGRLVRQTRVAELPRQAIPAPMRAKRLRFDRYVLGAEDHT
jgi:hypothetical protein